jgi:superfamily II DNA/RNA helicase
VLLTAEVGSEGVDLQFSRVLINYDLPWNPMKIEQRIGRIDRIGQEAEKIFIWNLGYADTIDERTYARLLAKLHIFKRVLGGMEAILGELINELTSDLSSCPLTAEQERKRIDRCRAGDDGLRHRHRLRPRTHAGGKRGSLVEEGGRSRAELRHPGRPAVRAGGEPLCPGGLRAPDLFSPAFTSSC